MHDCAWSHTSFGFQALNMIHCYWWYRLVTKKKFYQDLGWFVALPPNWTKASGFALNHDLVLIWVCGWPGRGVESSVFRVSVSLLPDLDASLEMLVQCVDRAMNEILLLLSYKVHNIMLIWYVRNLSRLTIIFSYLIRNNALGPPVFASDDARPGVAKVVTILLSVEQHVIHQHVFVSFIIHVHAHYISG